MKRSNSIFRTFLLFSYGSVVTFLLGFITSPILTRIFEPIEYGKQTIFVTILGVLQLLVVLGADQAFMRYYYVVKENDRLALTVKCLKAPLAATITLSVLLMASGKYLMPLYFDEYDIRVLLLLVASLIAGVIQGFSMNVIRMNKHANAYSTIQIIYKISNFLLIIGFVLLTKADFFAFIYATLISSVIGVGCAWVVEKDFWRGWRKAGARQLEISQKELVMYGLPFLPASLIYLLMNYVGIFSLKAMSTLTVVGIYAVAGSLVAPLVVFRTAFSTFWFPVAFERVESGKDYKDAFVSVNGLMTVILMAVSIVLIALKDIIVLILGARFREASVIMPFLIFMPMYYLLTETVNIGIRLANKLKYCIPVNIITLLVNVVGNVLMIPKFGASGAAMSTAVAYITFYYLNMAVSEKFHPIGFKWVRSLITTAVLFGIATWATFFKTDWMFIVVCPVAFLIVVVLFRDSLKKGFAYLPFGKGRAAQGTN